MKTKNDKPSPSALAMQRFVERSAGLREPRIAERIPGLPTLPDLKKIARDRRAAGHEVIDQSAGDIDDVGQPMSAEFLDWIEETRSKLLAQGNTEFRRVAGDPYGYPGNYQQQFPVVTTALAASWGIKHTATRAVQTISGRAAIDFCLRGLLHRAGAAEKGKRPALILDTLAWSGYQPLAADLGITLVHAPALPQYGLSSSLEGLRTALEFAQAQDLLPVGVLPILPSNPTGVGMPAEELVRFVECAAGVDLPVVIDGFYSPLAPEGHDVAVPLGILEERLAPEALGYLGVIVGETKVTSSQNKTGTLIWLAPEHHDSVAKAVIEAALKRLRSTNSYPRPAEALVAYALHTFPGGIKSAMGPRYLALDATRTAMQSACDEYGLPLAIGGSFYGTVALVDENGESLIRDAQGVPLTDPRLVSESLIDRFGLIGAPGGMFSSAPEANKMVRLTAAVTLEDVAKVRNIFGRMLDEAQHRC